ncbi:peroxiredoxin [Wallemia mellicola]|uniref:Putative peroxiredoxin n=1 Tax=Wallemia mellicola TaxID=1708541 RepID=A0AB38MZE2_9BASI|nr:peroxiredoxin [Wallemia mellicola]TIB90335.1 peroxiredoxin [Wallemia mellicola]TIC06295.1 peroxiredoxin [Wallemia mellicola]TIC19491.1 peroxiredoxin [Wallemia mellicola]TIC24577.1 peroxiredoxin [Wallemia mellicola]
MTSSSLLLKNDNEDEMVANIGDVIPDAKFKYIPYAEESIDVCGVPVTLNAHSEWKNKKVVIISVPGAFTPSCHMKHLPPFIEKAQEIHDKGVDVIAFLSANDPFVLSAWGKSHNSDGSIIFISDTYAEFSKQLGLEADLTDKGMGLRTSRYALIIDDLKIRKSAELDNNPVIFQHPNPPNEAAAFSIYHESHNLATAPYYKDSAYLTGKEELRFDLINPQASGYEQLARKLKSHIRRRSYSISTGASEKISALSNRIPSRRNSLQSSPLSASSSTQSVPLLGNTSNK